MFKHILLPTDGSAPSLRAVEKGADLARQLGADVTVMTAIEHVPAGVMGSPYRPEAQQHADAAHTAAVERLEAAEDVVRVRGVRCHRVLTREQPVYQGVISAAAAAGADLIVMGTHGASGLERLLLGSQTQRVLAHTQIPVLVLH
jgi:nucleotide-binding universal stress UspA family protein